MITVRTNTADKISKQYTRAKYIPKEQMYCMHCMYSTKIKLGRLLLLSKGHS